MDDAVVTQQPSSQLAGGGDASDSEVEVVEMKVKSAETLIRERRNKAKAAGQIISLTSASTTNASSIRSTFSSISATVTSMRSSTKPQERKVAIKSESVMITYEATRMVLTTDNNGVDKFAIAPGEKANERRISVSMNPFAQGGLRNVYRMQQKQTKQVAKESRHDIKYNERLRFHLETVKCQNQASMFANHFNKRIKAIRSERGALESVPRIAFLHAEVYRLNAPNQPGGFRYLAVEHELKGEYKKFNNNDGWINPIDCMKCKVAHAFSHFSYEHSNQQQMVVDIQGSSTAERKSMFESSSVDVCAWTDPQIHSTDKVFGRADRGKVGFDKFFLTHKCNFICQELGLPRRSRA